MNRFLKMSFYLRLGQVITKVITVVASVALLIMTGIVTANVLGRALFRSPVLATVEIVSLSGVLLISFAIAFTERERAHIVVQILTSRLPQRLQALFAIVTFFLSLGIVALLAWGGILEGWEHVITPGSTTKILRLSNVPFLFTWVAGCIVFLGHLLSHLLEELGKGRKK